MDSREPPPRTSHYPLPELIRYRDGLLEEARREALQDHLAECPECADLLLAYARLREGPQEPLGEDAAARERVWARLSARLPGSRPRQWVPAPALGWAASLLLAATVGLAFWNVSLEGDLRALRERAAIPPPAVAPDPRLSRMEAEIRERDSRIAALEEQTRELATPGVNAPIVDLFPQGASRGSAPEEAAVELPAESRFVTLILNLSSASPGEPRDLEVLDARGAVVFRREKVRPGPYGNFVLTFPRQALSPGSYRIRLGGAAEYRIRVEEP